MFKSDYGVALCMKVHHHRNNAVLWVIAWLHKAMVHLIVH